MKKIHFSKDVVMASIIVILLLVVGVGGGRWWGQQSVVAVPPAEAQLVVPEQQVLYWYDPMVPQQRFDKPGPSPFMDMDLVPMYANMDSTSNAVKIDPLITQNLGVRLATVTRIPLSTQVEATGVIGFNERDVAVVQSRSSGFVERVWPMAPGDLVKAGAPLVEMLAPEWTAAEYELLALKSLGDDSLVAAARQRLRLLGMPNAMIAAVEKSGTVRSSFIVTAPISGVVESLDTRLGMAVSVGQTVARVRGLSTVWMEVAVPEIYAGVLRSGAAAEIRLAGFPGQMLAGTVTTILPMLNEITRSLRVRIELVNRDGSLRPGLSGHVLLRVSTSESVLALPTEAVIRSGKRSMVMVAHEAGKFEPVEVEIGREIGAQTTIMAGLNEGDKVVASGQFLIDSEASFKGIIARSSSEAPSTPALVLHEATAIISELAPGEATLDHGPFKTLAMPGMEMIFPLAKPELVNGLKVGDRVSVAVSQRDAGLFVEKLNKIGGGS